MNIIKVYDIIFYLDYLIVKNMSDEDL